jgi:2-keto-3-deoxy-L-rhamnonate aldolase RhmA
VSFDSLKAMVGSREPKLGHFILEFASPGMGHILKNAGCDWVVFDTEHNGCGIETVKAMVRFAEAACLPMIVRVGSKDTHHISRVCDAGAEGVMLPLVGTPEEAMRILAAIKYTPQGERGVALSIAHDNYRLGPVADKLAEANKRTTVFLQIETGEGVANADAIAAIDDVDALWVGHFDLSCSLGIPGQFDHPRFKDAIATVLAACKRRGKSAGRVVVDVAQGAALYADGWDFIAYSADVWVYQAGVAAGIAGMRQAIAKGARNDG